VRRSTDSTAGDGTLVDATGAMAKARRTKESGNDASMNGDAQDRIAARAYELYLARGGTHGQDWDDWLAAEREFANIEPPPGSDRNE